MKLFHLFFDQVHKCKREIKSLTNSCKNKKKKWDVEANHKRKGINVFLVKKKDFIFSEKK